MAPLMASGHRPYIPMPQGRGFTDAMIIKGIAKTIPSPIWIFDRFYQKSDF
jgi:hypothetical protein